MGSTERVVHINHVRPVLTEAGVDHRVLPDWSPPLLHHEESLPSLPLAENQQDEPNQGAAATDLFIADIVEESPLTSSREPSPTVGNYTQWTPGETHPAIWSRATSICKLQTV